MTGLDASLSHLAYLALEQMIVTLQLKPGAMVTEKQLIDSAGQGRTPVREAIQKLAWQGLILVRPRVGMQIAEIRPGDHAEIMAVRLRLEPLAAGLMAQHAGDDVRQDLLDCAAAMTSAAVSGDILAFLAADKQFDDIVEAACPNRFVTSALSPLQTHSRRLWFSTATPEKMDRSVSLHVAVIRGIQKGDPVQTEKAMTALISALAERQ